MLKTGISWKEGIAVAKWVVMGAAAVDTVVRVPHLPKPDEIVYPESIGRYPGGSSANVAVGLSRLGESVSFLGKIGDDESGKIIAESFQKDGVLVSYLKTEPGKSSGGAFIAVDAAGERVIISLGGTTLYESWDELDPAAFDGMEGLYIGETFSEVGCKATLLAEEKKAPVFFGPGGIMCGYGLDYLGGVVKKTDYLLVNLPEALSLSGCKAKEDAITRLLEAGAKNVLLTEGKRGAGCYSREKSCFVPSYAVRAVDTTGAGDSFTAGFLSGTLHGWSVEKSLKFGSACAAAAIQKMGARSSMPTWEQVSEFDREKGQ